MKFILAIIALGLSWAEGLVATPVLFEWDRDPYAAGYRLYYGDSSHVYTNSVQVGQVTNLLVVLPPGRTYCSLVATNGIGDGPFSNEVALDSVESAKSVVVSVALERSGSPLFSNIVVLATFSVTNSTTTNDFYRAKMGVQIR